jgi:hypothetical protein
VKARGAADDDSAWVLVYTSLDAFGLGDELLAFATQPGSIRLVGGLAGGAHVELGSLDGMVEGFLTTRACDE